MKPDDVPASALKVAIVGGGSGGHLFPAIAVAQALLKQQPETRILFLVSHRPIDLRVMASADLPADRVTVDPYVKLSGGQHSIRGFSVFLRVWRAYRAARRALQSFCPDVVVGLGAMASVPGVIAASRLRIPIALMEQNTLPGKANRILARRARVTLAGMSFGHDWAEKWPCELIEIGTPVRQQIADLHGRTVVRSGQSRQLLILGGSQGSQSVNRLVLEALADERCVPSEWQIVHQTGESQVREVAAEYASHGRSATVLSFISDLPAQLAESTIVISRGGAGTLQELACAGLPSIVIPFSRAAGDHQRMNAACLSAAGAAERIDETDENAGTQLRELLNRLVSQPDLRLKYAENICRFARPKAAIDSAAIIMRIADRTV